MKSKKWVLWVILAATTVCALPCGFGIIAFKFSPYGRGDVTVKEDQSKAKKLGLISELSEVPQWVAKVEDSENSAPLYMAFFEAKKPFSKTELALIKVGRFGHGNEIEWETVAGYLKQLSPLVKQAHGITSKKGFDSTRTWNKGYAVLSPEFAQMKTIVWLLAWEALVKAHRGDRPGAIRDIAGLLNVSKHARAEPILIGLLIHEAIETIIWDALQEAISNGPLSAADRREIGVFVEKMGPDPDTTRVLWVEHLVVDQMAMTYGEFSLEEMTQAEKSAQRLLKFGPIRDANRAVLWENALKVQALLTQTGKTDLQLINEIDAEDQMLRQRKDAASIFARIVFPASRKRLMLVALRRKVRRDYPYGHCQGPRRIDHGEGSLL